MRAIVIVNGVPEDNTMAERYTTPLLPLVDRPFLQHVVEYLVESGVNTFDFLLWHLPEQVEALLGDGTRWGSNFRFHLASDSEQLYSLLRRQGGNAHAENEETVLLVHGDRLPHIELDSIVAQSEERTAPVLLRSQQGWLGWAVLPASLLSGVVNVTEESKLEAWLRSCPRYTQTNTEEFLEVRSFAGLLSAQRRVARGEFPHLLQTGRLVRAQGGQRENEDETIRLGRGAIIHPSARLIGPVYIGESSQIGENCCIGPNAVLGANVLVGDRTTIKDALLLPSTYVGDGLELSDVIADRARLWSVRHQDAVSVPDAFLLGDLTHNPALHWASAMQSRLGAFCALLLLWPVLVFTALCVLIFRRGALTYSHPFLTLPTTLDEREWREDSFTTFVASPKGLTRASHFLLHVLPGLVSVAQGKIRLVGVYPRSKQEVRQLESDFRALYLRSKPGLLHDINVGSEGVWPEEMEQQIAEGFYAATASSRTDLAVFGRYLQGQIR